MTYNKGLCLCRGFFDINMNDQLIHPSMSSFICQPSMHCCLSQGFCPDQSYANIDIIWVLILLYYVPAQLRMQVSLFHPQNGVESRQINLVWNRVPLAHCLHPVYLGAAVDTLLQATHDENKR